MSVTRRVTSEGNWNQTACLCFAEIWSSLWGGNRLETVWS